MLKLSKNRQILRKRRPPIFPLWRAELGLNPMTRFYVPMITYAPLAIGQHVWFVCLFTLALSVEKSFLVLLMNEVGSSVDWSINRVVVSHWGHRCEWGPVIERFSIILISENKAKLVFLQPPLYGVKSTWIASVTIFNKNLNRTRPVESKWYDMSLKHSSEDIFVENCHP